MLWKNLKVARFILPVLVLTVLLLPFANAVTLPSNIVYFAAITVNNLQTSALPPNAQITISYNALKYQSYETHSLNNTEFFYANGTLIPSWLEGNTLNEKAAANTLYQSANVLFWIRIYSSNTMFPASAGNTIYVGWAGNVVTAANDLMDGNTVGESPLISSSYGTLDNGANVFTQYGGGGTTKWSKFTYAGGTWLTTNGYLQQTAAATNALSGGAAALIESTSYPASGTYVLEMTFNYTTQHIARVGIVAVATPSGGDVFGYRFIGQQNNNGVGFLSFLNDLVAWVVNNLYSGAVSTPYTMSVTDVAGKWSGSLYSGYGLGGSVLTSLASTTYTTANHEGVSTGYVGISATYYNGANTVTNPINVQWFRMRTYPPNGVMPTIAFKTVQSILAATPNPYTLTNKTIDINQISIANTVISNGEAGTTSYTSNWLWSTPSSSNIVAGNTPIASLPIANNALTLTINAVAANSLKLTFNSVVYYANTIGTNTIYGTWTFNAFAGDSGNDISPIPVLTNTITINPALSVGAITPSAPSIDSGQSITLTSHPSGGTTTYSYQWYTGSACNTILSGNTLQTYSPSPISNTIYSVKVTDSASTPFSICSSGDTVTVNPALGAVSTPSISAAKLEVNQVETVTGTMPSTGTSPYTYNWLVSINSGAYAAATQCATNSGSGQISGNTVTCAISASTLTAGNTYNFELKVTDNSVTPSTATSSASPTVSVSSQLTVATPTVSAPKLDVDQAETITGTIPSTGTSPYTYNWLVSTNGGVSYSATTQCATNSGSGQTSGNTVTCSIAANTLTVGTNYLFELKVTDSATTPETVSSSASPTISVSSQLTPATTPTISASKLDADQTETITGTIPSTGTSLYAYAWQVSTNGGSFMHTTQCTSNIGSNQIAGNTVTCTIPGNTLAAGNTYAFKLEIVDSATIAEDTVSAASSTVTVSSQLGSPSPPSTSNPKLDVNQAEVVTDTIPSTGTSPYTYNWLVSTNGGVSYSATTPCTTTSGSGQSSGNTVTCSIPVNTLTIGTNYLFELKVTDSASTQETATSSASTSVTVSSQLTAPAIPTISANNLDVYQIETINGIIPSTGTSPYSYTWHISVNGGAYSGATQCTQNTGSNQIAGNTVTCTIPRNTLSGGNSYNFALEVVDSATAQESAFSASSNTIMVASPAVANAPAVSATNLDSDQEESVTGVMPSTGTAPYTYNWLISNNGGSYQLATQCTVDTGNHQANGNTVICNIIGGNLIATHTYSFELQITDSDSTPDTTVSAPTANVVAASPLTASSTPLISAANIDVNQAETITSIIPSTGTSPYSYTWHISVNGGAYFGATQCTTNTGSNQIAGNTVTCTVPANTLSGGNTYNFELEVTDSATAQESAFSASSNTITVNSLLIAPSAPTLSAPYLDVDEVESVTDMIPSTGTSPYTYNWLVSKNGGSYSSATQCGTPSGSNQISGNTVTCNIAVNTLTANNVYNFELQVTDAAALTATSSASSTLTVSSQLTPALTPTVSGAYLDVDQTEIVTGIIPSTGTPLYYYHWHISTDGGPYIHTSICTVNIGSNQLAGNTVTCIIPGNTLAAGNTYGFILHSLDSATLQESTLSPPSTNVIVSSQLTAPSAPTISASKIDADQVETVTGVMPSTGNFPYSYSWLISNNGGVSYVAATQCTTNTGSNQIAGNTVTCTVPGNTLSANQNYNFELKVTDSASTPEIVTSSASSAVAVSSELAAPSTPAISASKLDVDEAETITGVIPSTGTSTYAYAWYVSVNGGAYATTTQCATNSGTGRPAGNTVICAIPVNTLTISNTYNFKLQVSDGASTSETTNSPSSSTITVSSQLTASTTPSISAANIDSDQVETITGTIPSTGTSPYSYTWHISVNGGAYFGATQCTTNTGSNQIAGNTVTCTMPGGMLSAGNSYNFALEVTDSATAQESSFTASSNTITVNSPLAAPSAPAVSALKLDTDQVETVTATMPSTGTSPYTYNWLVSVNSGAYTATTQCIANSGSGQSSGNTVTCTILGSTLTAGDTYNFKLQVNDSASSPEFATSSASSTVAVSSQLTISTAPTISANNLDVYQIETINDIIPSTGTSPYSYTWHISVNGGAYSGATQCTQNTGSNQIAGNTVTCTIPRNTLSGGNSYNFALEVVDSATVQESAFSTSSNTIMVASPAVANAPAVSATNLDSDQTEIVTGVMPSTGTPPYTYNWLISNNGGSYQLATQCDFDTGSGQANGNTVICNIFGGNLIATHTYSFELQITDSDSTPDTTISSPTANVVVSSPLAAPSTPSISAANLDSDQVETITGTIPSTGTSPYSYTWHISTNGGTYFGATQCTTNTGSNQIAGNTVTCTIPANTLSGGNTYNFELEVTDSATAQESAFSASSSTVTVYSPLTAPSAPAITAPKLDVDQVETVTGTIPSSGAAPYTYNWLVSTNGGVSYSTTTPCSTTSGTGQSSGNTVTCIIPASTLSTTYTYLFELKVSDSSQTVETATSSASPAVTVSPQLTSSTKPSISSPSIDAGQSESITSVLPSTGTSPYSYTWHISVNGGSYSGATQCTTNTGSGQSAGNTVTCTIPSGTLSGGNTYNFELEVVDSSSTSESTFSLPSNTITVGVTPTATSLTPSSSQLSSGQTVTYSVLVNDGTGPFTANLVASNGTVVNTLTGQFAGTIIFGAITPPVGTDSYNAVVTDTGTNPPYIFNSSSSTITVIIPGQNQVLGSGPTSTTSTASTTSVSTSTSTTPTTTTSTTTVPAQITSQHLNVSGNNVSTIIGVPVIGASTLNLNSNQVYLTIQSSSAGYFNITIVNVTNNSTAPLAGYEKPLALRINASGTVQPKSKLTILARTRYDCSIPSNQIAPYLLSNGTWQPIIPFTVNSLECELAFNVTVDTTVALLEPITPAHSTTTVPVTPARTSALGLLYAAAAIALIALVAIYLVAKRRRKKPNPIN
jgi:hypothetical protein